MRMSTYNQRSTKYMYRLSGGDTLSWAGHRKVVSQEGGGSLIKKDGMLVIPGGVLRYISDRDV